MKIESDVRAESKANGKNDSSSGQQQENMDEDEREDDEDCISDSGSTSEKNT